MKFAGLKVRRRWKINPKTRVKGKKGYSRQNSKRKIEGELLLERDKAA